MNSLKQLRDGGQSIWLDYIRRDLITSGEFQRLVEEDGVHGVTSNPTIFDKAIAAGTDYDDALRSLLAADPDRNRRRHPAHPNQARVADHLPWRGRNGGAEQRRTPAVLLGRSDGALQRASADNPLSFGGAGVDASAAAGTPRDRRRRRVPHRHRPSR